MPRLATLALPGLLVLCHGAAAPEPRWAELNHAAHAAVEAKDYQKLRSVLTELRPLMPGNPRITYNLAASNAKLGDKAAALQGLQNLTTAGLIYDFAKDEDFASVQADPRFAAIQKSVEANKRPITHAQLAFALQAPDLLPEDIAWDAATRRFLISSVRQKQIQWSDGQLFATADLPVMALEIDAPRHKLWAAIAWLPHCASCAAADKDKTALLAFDLHTGALLQRVDLPEKGMLGDMTISPRGDLFASEGIYGSVWRLPVGAHQLERLDQPGEFPSPQQPALSPDGQTLYVPDYARGIAAMNLATKSVQWLVPADDVILSGIDGFHLYRNQFIAVQNGTNPARIIRFSLDLQKQEILETNWPGLSEPTHGAVVDGSYYFLTNTGWSSYDDEGKKKDGTLPVKSAVYKRKLTS